MNKFLKILIWIILTDGTVYSQVQKKITLEHFTNTSCSVCASNNHTITDIGLSNPNIIYISYHPSAPYPSDYFNQQNKEENDNRTNYYNQYGSTPRVVLNGKFISYPVLATEIANLNDTVSSVEIRSKHSINSNNQVKINITLIRRGMDSVSFYRLFVCATEDTVFKTTNNGETQHYHVFRKALTTIIGDSIVLGANIGDSLNLEYLYKPSLDENTNRIYGTIILQGSNKEIIQSGKTLKIQENTNSILNNSTDYLEINIYPNPVRDILNIESKHKRNLFTELFDIYGKLVYTSLKPINEVIHKINMSDFPSDIYFIRVKDETGYILINQKIIF